MSIAGAIVMGISIGLIMILAEALIINALARRRMAKRGLALTRKDYKRRQRF